MRKQKPLTDEEGEVRELLLEDVEQLPADPRSATDREPKKLGIEPEKPPKEKISLDISSDVLDRFRATGPGWQTRVDAALREWLESHPAE